MPPSPAPTATSSFLLAAARLLQRRSRVVQLIVLLLSLGLGLAAARITVDNSIGVWQADHDPAWRHFLDFSKRYQVVDPLVILLPAAGLAPAALDKIIGAVRKALDARSLPAHLGGVWYLTAVLDRLSSESAARLFPVVFCLMAAGVFYTFTRLWPTAVILACGALPALWLTGLMALDGIKMNMVLLALPPLTMILGISHAIHFLLKENDPDTPLITFCATIRPCALSALTTMLGFFSLTLSAYAPVRSLGVWGATGVALSFLLTIVLVPGIYPARRPRPRHAAAWQALARNIGRHPGHLFTALLVVAVLAAGMGKLKRSSFILDFLDPALSARRDHLAIEQTGVGLTPIEVEIEGARLPPGRLFQLVSELARSPLVTHFLFFSGHDPSRFQAVATSNGAEFDQPLLPGAAGRPVTRMTILTRTVSSEETLAFADRIENLLRRRLGPRPTPYVTGSVPLFTRGQARLFSTLINSFAAAFVSIAVVIGLVLGSWRLGVLAMIPNLAPVAMILGVMGWSGIPLSVATVTVASIVFGVVVDDTIHFLHTWRRFGRLSRRRQRLAATLGYAGPAMLCTSVVAGGSFLGFLASPFVPLRNFGLLIALALALAILCDLILLPLLLLRGRTNEETP